jgi:hypothetical protein
VSKINTPRQRLLRRNCPSPGMIKEADIPKAGLVEGVGVFFEVGMKVFVVETRVLVRDET